VTQLISSGATWMPHSCCNRKSNKKREVVGGVWSGGRGPWGGQSQTVHLHALALITFTLNF